MSKPQGDKTEQPTPRKLEEARKRGEFARSPEVQTVFVLGSGTLLLLFTGSEVWNRLAIAVSSILGHLHDLPISQENMQSHALHGILVAGSCVLPIFAGAVLSGLLAGGLQSRFQTASEALNFKWERVDPIKGCQRIFSLRAAVPALLAALKLAVITLLIIGVVRTVVRHPVLTSPVELAAVNDFLASSALKIVLRVLLALAIIGAIDYSYRLWRTQQDLMMTRTEVRDELKNAEGDPLNKSRQRRRQQAATKRRMLLDVPTADVVITNPTQLAIALRYDRRAMKAPRIVARGSRLNAHRIRDLARQNQIPIVENKPLARLLFRHGRVGQDIPAELYVAVAELLAWVYRVNAYRYYRENQPAS
jgi:flagellar biosynthesis protein FlhB